VIFESGDAIFHEENFPFKSKNSGGKEVVENVLSQPSSSTHSQNQENLIKELELKKILAQTVMFLMLMKIL